MRLLHPVEVNTVSGAGLLGQVNALGFKLQQEVAKRGITAVIDPYGGSVTVNTPLGSKTVPVPAEVLGLLLT